MQALSAIQQAAYEYEWDEANRLAEFHRSGSTEYDAEYACRPGVLRGNHVPLLEGDTVDLGPAGRCLHKVYVVGDAVFAVHICVVAEANGHFLSM